MNVAAISPIRCACVSASPTSNSSPFSTNVNPKNSAPKNAAITCRMSKCPGIFSTSLSLIRCTSCSILSIRVMV